MLSISSFFGEVKPFDRNNLAIDIPPMADLDYQDQQVLILDLIDNPETAHPDTVELVLIRQFLHALGSGSLRQAVDGFPNLRAGPFRKGAKRLKRPFFDPDTVDRCQG